MIRKALVIGIDDYPYNPLNGCINDAGAVKSVLERNGDGSPNFDVRLITESNEAGKSSLKRMVRELFNTESDIALLYYAGHGMITPTGGFIVTLDGQNDDEGISMDEILKMANDSRASSKMIIMDCCYAGSFGESKYKENISYICKELNIIAACREYESAVEGENGHGVFTSLLLDALSGGAADVRGYITAGSVYAYIDSALGAWEQRPIFKANVSKFVSIRNIPPKIPFKTLRKIVEYFPVPQEKLSLNPSYEPDSGQAVEENVRIFRDLQKYVSEGLVKPVGAEHMYYAAMESKSCKLTALGSHYWSLVKQKRI
ncbi:caspase family protein [Methanosarcina sp.]|uniref:caspase family protein n=1 Tax=Methanosarcina sp. TaxID=2213 RepID=UPI0029881A83|nr:caspase family protein [Methanosarcina sp.]MDW5550375.1 caspase family protein [Methanosarcina sp.]MDW5554699.1 caspase family protein [Methanosarcina sp.]MDW5560486.1 caspase family protein [Methanosarcina sp.]